MALPWPVIRPSADAGTPYLTGYRGTALTCIRNCRVVAIWVQFNGLPNNYTPLCAKVLATLNNYMKLLYAIIVIGQGTGGPKSKAWGLGLVTTFSHLFVAAIRPRSLVPPPPPDAGRFLTPSSLPYSKVSSLNFSPGN